jgi:hypothetical protein
VGEGDPAGGRQGRMIAMRSFGMNRDSSRLRLLHLALEGRGKPLVMNRTTNHDFLLHLPLFGARITLSA